VLTKNGFIDYSLFMIVVLRPFKHVDHFKPSTLGTSAFDDMRTIPDEQKPFLHTSTATPISAQKRLFIGEVDPRMLIRGGDPSQ
jgi:hypothetical protein